jgi:hypothetical protein
MFGKKKLYTEGAQAEGQVFALTSYGVDGMVSDYGVKVRVKFPDGSTTQFEKGPLQARDVGQLYVGSVVPVRYDRANQSKVILDIPALRERQAQIKAGQQAQLDSQFAQLGGPGAPAAAGLGDLRTQLLRLATQNGGSVIDLRSSQPGAEQDSDPADRLTKLAALKERGLLTDAEFAAAKTKILTQS